MDEEILLKRRLIDTANKAYRQNIYTYTNFFSMSELDTYYRALPELSFIHSEAFGGSASCERHEKYLRYDQSARKGCFRSDGETVHCRE